MNCTVPSLPFWCRQKLWGRHLKLNVDRIDYISQLCSEPQMRSHCLHSRFLFVFAYLFIRWRHRHVSCPSAESSGRAVVLHNVKLEVYDESRVQRVKRRWAEAAAVIRPSTVPLYLSQRDKKSIFKNTISFLDDMRGSRIRDAAKLQEA